MDILSPMGLTSATASLPKVHLLPPITPNQLTFLFPSSNPIHQPPLPLGPPRPNHPPRPQPTLRTSHHPPRPPPRTLVPQNQPPRPRPQPKDIQWDPRRRNHHRVRHRQYLYRGPLPQLELLAREQGEPDERVDEGADGVFRRYFH